MCSGPHESIQRVSAARLEIEMIMAGAARIERRPAGGTAVSACEIAGHAQFHATCAAEHGWTIPFGDGPRRRGVIGQGVVAFAAGVVLAAAAHADGDDVARAVIVSAARLGVEIEAGDRGTGATQRSIKASAIRAWVLACSGAMPSCSMRWIRPTNRVPFSGSIQNQVPAAPSH